MSSTDLRPIVSFEVVPEHCIRNDQLELILGTPINQVIFFKLFDFYLFSRLLMEFKTSTGQLKMLN